MVGPSIKVLLLLLKAKANNSLGPNRFLIHKYKITNTKSHILTIPTWLVHLSKSSFFSSRLKRTTPLVQILFSPSYFINIRIVSIPLNRHWFYLCHFWRTTSNTPTMKTFCSLIFTASFSSVAACLLSPFNKEVGQLNINKHGNLKDAIAQYDSLMDGWLFLDSLVSRISSI